MAEFIMPSMAKQESVKALSEHLASVETTANSKMGGSCTSLGITNGNIVSGAQNITATFSNYKFITVVVTNTNSGSYAIYASMTLPYSVWFNSQNARSLTFVTSGGATYFDVRISPFGTTVLSCSVDSQKNFGTIYVRAYGVN